MANVLYTLIIYPLTLVIETAYQLVYAIFGNAGFAAIGVSVAVSFLCLPLYIVAEAWQETERKKQKEMEAGIARIKKTFKGDEQYMILTTFYRQNHYHPLMALRSSFGLLIQVPFFIAAYSFLSNMPALQGQPFAFIKDMGKPDALFYVGSFPINVLPIAMTAINIAGSAVYTKGFKLKEKLPIYAMALIFLALLYDSPAGLVLYWTMNNVFSLVKNVFYKIKRPLLALYILASAASIAGIIYMATIHNGLESKRFALETILTAVIFSPLLVKAAGWLLKNPLKSLAENKGERRALFFLSAVSLALLTGLVIPSNVISSSAVEFMNIDKIQNPNSYVFTAFLQSLGIFCFWFCCVYFLFGKKVQSLMAAGSALALLWGTLDAFVFVGDYGSISRSLVFDRGAANSIYFCALNAAALLALGAAFLCLLKFVKAKNGAIPLFAILLCSFLAVGAINISKIQKENDLQAQRNFQEATKIEPALRLSKNGKNVVVIMADRAESVYVQSIMNAYPKLKEEYKDWTFYSHALSYDSHTLLGAPPLYGGYEYTPLEMNKRDTVPLKEKNNEALLLMPRVFTEQAGFDAQVFDLSWANYSWIPDMSICKPYPKIAGSNLERKYTSKWIEEHPDCVSENALSSSLKRNFLMLSIFKEAPAFLRESLYDDGLWWSSDESYTDMVDYISYYSVLDYLPELTAFDGSDAGDFVLLQTMATHTSIELQAPDFVPAKEVTDRGPLGNAFGGYASISSNAAFLRRLAEWMDYLRRNDCYDNTRIIVVADHGIGGANIENLFFYGGPALERLRAKGPKKTLAFEALIESITELGYNLDHNHPLLMMKDFTDTPDKKSAGRQFTADNRFMTNADVPALAFEGIVKNPTNPWTGKPIQKRSEDAAYGVAADAPYDPAKHGVFKYKLKGVKMFDVFDNMANISNWKERKE